jgi:serine/threonine protein kinase
MSQSSEDSFGNFFGGNGRPKSFVGTPLYVSPEMLTRSNSGAYTDLWALGIIIFEMAFGRTPFAGNDQQTIFDNVISHRLMFPPDADESLCNLINNLLTLNPDERFKICAFPKLKSH